MQRRARIAPAAMHAVPERHMHAKYASSIASRCVSALPGTESVVVELSTAVCGSNDA